MVPEQIHLPSPLAFLSGRQQEKTLLLADPSWLFSKSVLGVWVHRYVLLAGSGSALQPVAVLKSM